MLHKCHNYVLFYAIMFWVFLTDEAMLQEVDLCKSNNKKISIIYNLSTIDSPTNISVTVFSNFVTFDELFLACNHTYSSTEFLEFIPRKQIILNRKFGLDVFMNAANSSKIKGIILRNFKGIDLYQLSLIKHVKNIILSISYSRLDIYANGELITEENCNEITFESINRNSSMLPLMNSLVFNKVIYPKRLCPLMFRRSTILSMKFGEITDSLLTKNQLFFTFNESYSHIKVNKLIVLQFDVYYVSLTARMIDKYLFKTVQELKVTHVVKRIDGDLFVNFKQLKTIDFQIDNLKEFFHVDTKWMSKLNWNINIDLSNMSEWRDNLKRLMRMKFQFPKRYVSFDVIYEYPDEDICLFRYFPHNHMVYPILRPGKQLKCTCTIAWLQMYAYLYEPVVNLTDNYNLNYQNDHLFLLNLKYTFLFCSDTFRCDFKRLFNNCDRFSFQMASNSLKLNNDVDVYFLIKWLQFILLTILQPIFALLGIINNLLTIIVIMNK